MKTVPILSPAQAAELIADGDTITVSSSSGLGCPDLVLKAIGERYDATNQPRNLTSLHPIAAGDMYGIRGVDHIAKPGLLSRIVAGSYPSGPSRSEPPAIWKMIVDEEIEAYNFPSGVIFQMHRAGATHQAGVFSKVGLQTFIDPRHEGGRMNTTTASAFVRLATVGNEEYLHFDAAQPNVAIIRATTADETGNLTFEQEGSPLGALDQAYAAKAQGGIVIAQVKQVAAAGSLEPQRVRVPGILVDAIVIHENQLQTTETFYDPAISGELQRPNSALPVLELSLEKAIARRAAQELARGETVNLGFGVSALVPHVLNEEGLHESVSWVLEQGAVGGTPLLDFAFGCSQNPDAIMQSADQFTLLQGGTFSHTLLSFLEIDAAGNVNVHNLPGRRHVTAGVGGFVDITTHAPRIIFMGSFTAGRKAIALTDEGGLNIKTDGPHTKLVKRVSSISFNGARALEKGQEVLYITERCVLKLTGDGLMVTEIAPGVDLHADILARAEFPLLVSEELTEMDPRLFTAGPAGIHLAHAREHERIARVLGYESNPKVLATNPKPLVSNNA